MHLSISLSHIADEKTRTAAWSFVRVQYCTEAGGVNQL